VHLVGLACISIMECKLEQECNGQFLTEGPCWGTYLNTFAKEMSEAHSDKSLKKIVIFAEAMCG